MPQGIRLQDLIVMVLAVGLIAALLILAVQGDNTELVKDLLIALISGVIGYVSNGPEVPERKNGA